MKSIYEIGEELKELGIKVSAKINDSKLDYPDDKLWSHGDVLLLLKSVKSKVGELDVAIRAYDKEILEDMKGSDDELTD